MPVDVVGGTSQGAFMAGLYAQGLTREQLQLKVRKRVCQRRVSLPGGLPRGLPGAAWSLPGAAWGLPRSLIERLPEGRLPDFVSPHRLPGLLLPLP